MFKSNRCYDDNFPTFSQPIGNDLRVAALSYAILIDLMNFPYSQNNSGVKGLKFYLLVGGGH